MATYAIGDIQGCYESLLKLLDEIQFDSAKDQLWFTGDLVNRGPKSLEVLRFVKSLGPQHKIVLGNHDLHLLALNHGVRRGRTDDTLQPILKAHDKDELLHWLANQPLFYYDDKLQYALVHAGLAPMWNLTSCLLLSQEVENILQNPNLAAEFYFNMYGDVPALWSQSLTGWERLRCITNYFTRARFFHPDGSLELKEKGKMGNHTDRLIPWFKFPDRQNKDFKIVFGHWAALGGVTDTENVFALDTGCIWGYALTAMRLEDQKRFSVKSYDLAPKT